MRKSQEAFTLAYQLSHPYSLVYALSFAGVLHHLRREVQETQERVEALLPLARKHGFPMWVGFGMALQGWVLAEEGCREEGIKQMRQGAVAWQTTGAEVWRPYLLALPVEAYKAVRQIEEGLALVSEALTLVDARGERFHEVELYRLKGELLLEAAYRMQNDERKAEQTGYDPAPIQHSSLTVHRSTEAEAYFFKAIEVAQKQQAKSWELRAVMSLARLWQSQGKQKEALKLLSEVYHWFTEGFDTKDLQEAKALLEELSH